MPLARIFTRYPERAAALSGQLQQQGYRVEVSGPEQAYLPPADLEIEFEICDRADVLERAAQLAEELQADVAIAPGVLQSQPEPAAEPLPAVSARADELPAMDAHAVAELLPMEAAAQAPVEVVPAEFAAVAPETAAQEQCDREREFEEAFQPDHARMMHASEREKAVEEPLPAVIERQTTEDALPPVEMLEEEPSAMRAEPVAASVVGPVVETAPPATLRETARPADPVPYLAELTPFRRPAEHAPTGAAEYRSAQYAHEVLPQPAGERAAAESVGGNLASIFSTAMTGLKSASASTAESFRERVQEYKKRAQVRRAEAHAARVARMLDLEQRKAEAHQRAMELEAAREAASARLVKLVRERQPGLTEEDRKAAPVPEPAPYLKPVESLRHASITRMQAKPRKPMSPQLRAVLTGAAAVTLIFVIGIVLGEFYPRTPLASPGDRSSNGVSVQTGAPAAQSGGVTVKIGDSAPPTTAAQPHPSAVASQTQTPTAAKPSPRVAQARHMVSSQDEQAVGDDVVVRHFSRSAATQKPKQSAQQAGWKHFSDMDN